MQKIAKWEMVMLIVMAATFAAMVVMDAIFTVLGDRTTLGEIDPAFFYVCGVLLVMINMNLIVIRGRLSGDQSPKPMN